MISQRIQEEDLFTVIDTFMMPYGTECDLYQIMGEIKNVESAVNEYTDEKTVLYDTFLQRYDF